MKIALSDILNAENKGNKIIEIFGNTDNFQNSLSAHIVNFINDFFSITTKFSMNNVKSNLKAENIISPTLLDKNPISLFEISEDDDQQMKAFKTQIHHYYLESEKIAPLATEYFGYALSCLAANLVNSGRKFLSLAIEDYLNQCSPISNALKNAKVSEAKSEIAKTSAKKGAEKRWKAKEKTKQFALELYKSGTFKNPSQGAEKLTEQIFEYGKSVGFHFSGIFQANKTIYKWFLD
ncbi:hypothetical protein [Thalassotalea sp. G2M2-11]|uniref:hypothetical protein n=1 Tax=Thalassotalea sp. G2M2-11 TaxID=2787627 RepID=UPI0019D27DE1|nr:hypothetical protein [Thalassotalea sp. G2M2-11]